MQTQILLDYLPGSGGEAVASAVERFYSPSFRVDTRGDISRFRAISEAPDRFKLIHGRLARFLFDSVSDKATRIALVESPSRRVCRYLEESARSSAHFLHPIAKKLAPWKIAQRFPDFQNMLARTFNPDHFDVIATDPISLVRYLGVPAIRYHEPDFSVDGKVDESNAADVAMFSWLKSMAGEHGIYFRNRKWHASEVAIITTHFNPTRSRRLRETFGQWKESIGHPFVCYESAIDGKGEIDGSVVFSAGPENNVWQKERLINLALADLPIHVRYVAWVDHDIIFGNTDWLEKSVEMLRSGYQAVQLFSRYTHLGKNGEVVHTATGGAYDRNNNGTNPGGAWIADRKWLDSIGGLYDRSIVGGGDAIWFAAITGDRRGYESRHSPQFIEHIERYYAKVGRAKIGHLPGEVFHLWHGGLENRQYISRDETMAGLGFDPAVHVGVSKNGLIGWTEAASSEMRSAVERYFLDRRDDG
jgi:hypothetical protein